MYTSMRAAGLRTSVYVSAHVTSNMFHLAHFKVWKTSVMLHECTVLMIEMDFQLYTDLFKTYEHSSYEF